MLDLSHWLAGRGPVGQCFHWSSIANRWGTLAQEVYDFRGSLEASMVGFQKVPTKQWPRQSCDDERMAVELVAELYCMRDLPVHLDVVAVHCNHLHGHVGRVLHGTLLRVSQHVASDDGRRCSGVHKVHWLGQAEEVADMRLRIDEGGRNGLQLDPPDLLAFTGVLLDDRDFGQPFPLQCCACAPYLLW